jgi:hypothetical protein
MTACRSLEAQIEQSSVHAANLLQAVPRDAFAPPHERIEGVLSHRELEGVFE